MIKLELWRATYSPLFDLLFSAVPLPSLQSPLPTLWPSRVLTSKFATCIEMDSIKSKGGINSIPIDVLIEILSRLPAESLLKFRRVCKLWRSITQERYFIAVHLDRTHKYQHPSILFLFNTSCWDRYGIVTINNKTRALNGALWSPKPPGKRVYLHGSCNGLLCISCEHTWIKLVNPTTGESQTLSLPPMPSGEPLTSFTVGFYFGFHEETKEYKVVCFTEPYPQGGSVASQVYTLGTNAWRQLYNFVDFNPRSTHATVKGAMYWRERLKLQFVSFDLKDEKFCKFAAPEIDFFYREKSTRIFGHLKELQGSLCLPVSTDVVENKSQQKMDLWMMTLSNDDKGITKHEWALKYSLILPRGLFWPLVIHKEKVLMHRRDSQEYLALLKYYHLKGNEEEIFCHSVELPMEELDKSGQLFSKDYMHLESLVPLQS